MKRIALFLSTLVALLIFFTACGAPAEPADTQASPEITERFSEQITVEEFYGKFKDAGLPVDFDVIRTEDDDDLLGRPNKYTSRLDFADMTVKQDFITWTGGSIYVFDNEHDAQAYYVYLDAFNQSGLTADYIHINGAAVLSIDSDLRPSDAARYEAVFFGREISEEQPGKIVQLKVPLDWMFFTDEQIETIKSSPEPSDWWKSVGVSQRYIEGDTYVIEVPENRKAGFLASRYNESMIDVLRLKNGPNTPYVIDIHTEWNWEGNEHTHVTVTKAECTREDMIDLACGISIKKSYYYALLGTPDKEFSISIYDENNNLIMVLDFQSMDFEIRDW